ncbi:hypothetical protein RRG08_041116 [Elysia crispata]|uniref:Uncharacterized protein n=1 Tax=Elysia crispata TaxID=231223 RepID=A0AAE0XY44_9GAST|nr:hypothetical protein RRG08_041116 [Elysia crispata]
MKSFAVVDLPTSVYVGRILTGITQRGTVGYNLLDIPHASAVYAIELFSRGVQQEVKSLAPFWPPTLESLSLKVVYTIAGALCLFLDLHGLGEANR